MRTLLAISAALFAALLHWGMPAREAAAQGPPLARPYDYHHASTYEEGLARGLSSIIRASGEAALLTSEAAKNFEEARALNLENRIKATQTYFELRRINQQERFGQREAFTSEQLFRTSQARLPERLSPSQLDPVTGAIDWPLALRAAPFAGDRQVIERVIAARAQAGVFSLEEYARLRDALARAEEALRVRVDSIPTSQYIRAANFLKSLAFEAELATR